MNIDLTQIILAVIALLCTILTKYAIPLLISKKASASTENDIFKYTMLQTAIKTAVFAAEQIYKSEEGEKKKAYVLSLLECQGYKVDTASVDASIEAAVKELKIAISK